MLNSITVLFKTYIKKYQVVLEYVNYRIKKLTIKFNVPIKIFKMIT